MRIHTLNLSPNTAVSLGEYSATYKSGAVHLSDVYPSGHVKAAPASLNLHLEDLKDGLVPCKSYLAGDSVCVELKADDQTLEIWFDEQTITRTIKALMVARLRLRDKDDYGDFEDQESYDRWLKKVL